MKIKTFSRAEEVILIIASQSFKSINLVSNWLTYYKANHFVIQTSKFKSDFEFLANKKGIYIKKKSSKFLKVKAIWYYRDENGISSDYPKQIRSHIIAELEVFKGAFYSSIFTGRIIGDYRKIKVNKIDMLTTAKNAGLCTLDFIVTNSRQELRTFYLSCHKKIICKPLSNNLTIRLSNEIYTQYVKKIHASDIDSMQPTFGISFFQKAITNKSDVRVVFFIDKVYAIRIDSELLDYKEDYEKSHMMPIDIPVEIQMKIGKFMNQIELNMGSLDFIIDRQTNEWFFLEINPIGMFDFVSEIGNYSLDEKIAKYLIS